ncbi:Signal transduction histidine kinase [Arboricoccus pini]|uniref:histidine kinase n=1 Tax=Arboricoccus pini TaxID=1963835 RepID=A0A212R480_9PROT|nr:ATP-binding protein [Arboricoccus pini]SNB66628.1 Signal transduction histidine kinase [Arboricoccus pini]
MRDLVRRTGFRLLLLALLIFGAIALGLSSFFYWQTQDYLVHQIDSWLFREASRLAQIEPNALAGLLQSYSARNIETDHMFMLYDPTGHQVAGFKATLPQPLETLDQPVNMSAMADGKHLRIRGIAHRAASGYLVIVGRNLHELSEFDERLARAVYFGGIVTAVLGLAGAALVGLDASRRLTAVNVAIDRIIHGDLQARLPLARNSGDIGRIAAGVNAMLDHIERLMLEVKGAGDNIAHDLRTPLSRLLAGLERVRRRDPGREDYAFAIDEAIGEVHSILRTFNALLRIAEVEHLRRKAGFITVNIGQIAEDVFEFYDPMAEEKGIAFTYTRPSAEGPMIEGDASLLFEAIGNLVDNSLKFTPSGGEVCLKVLATEQECGIEVIDTGPGIPPEERVAVLARFHRTEPSRTVEGNGLGLSLVAVVAKLHGMKLTIGDVENGCSIALTFQWQSTPVLAVDAK